MISVPRIGMGLLDSLTRPLFWILLHVWTFTAYGEAPTAFNTRRKEFVGVNLSYRSTDTESSVKAEMGAETKEKRPDMGTFTTIENDGDDDEGDADHGRPFTLEFVKRAAKESQDVHEFLSSLLAFKEGSF